MSVPEPKTNRLLLDVATRAEVWQWDVSWGHGNPSSSTNQSQIDLHLFHGCGRWVGVKAFTSDRVRKYRRDPAGPALTDHQRRVFSRMAAAGCEILIVAPTPEDDAALSVALACGCDSPSVQITAQGAGEAGFRPSTSVDQPEEG